jgi:hypothetical protein
MRRKDLPTLTFLFPALFAKIRMFAFILFAKAGFFLEANGGKSFRNV